MKMPCVTPTTTDWLGGLISAAMGAISPAVSANMIDPKTFNLHDGLYNLGLLCFYPALISVAAYLKRRPLPGVTEPNA